MLRGRNRWMGWDESYGCREGDDLKPYFQGIINVRNQKHEQTYRYGWTLAVKYPLYHCWTLGNCSPPWSLYCLIVVLKVLIKTSSNNTRTRSIKNAARENRVWIPSEQRNEVCKSCKQTKTPTATETTLTECSHFSCLFNNRYFLWK